MSYKNKMQIIPIRAQILHAWNTEKDRDDLLKSLGGINVDGSLNESRILQIMQAIESVQQARLDDEREQLRQ